MGIGRLGSGSEVRDWFRIGVRIGRGRAGPPAGSPPPVPEAPRGASRRPSGPGEQSAESRRTVARGGPWTAFPLTLRGPSGTLRHRLETVSLSLTYALCGAWNRGGSNRPARPLLRSPRSSDTSVHRARRAWMRPDENRSDPAARNRTKQPEREAHSRGLPPPETEGRASKAFESQPRAPGISCATAWMTENAERAK